MQPITIETRREAADRIAIAESLKREADHKAHVAQVMAADAILGRNTVEHVTLWTESNGRPRHESRVEVVS